MKKLISLFFISLILISVLSACAFSKEYIIATDDSFSPFSSKSVSGEAVGFEPELIKLIAKEEGINVNIIPAGLLSALEALEKDDADAVIAAIIPTEEFNEKFDFSDYYYSEYALAVGKGKNKDLIKKFNNGLQKVIENGKYKELIDKYAIGDSLYE